MSDVTVVDVVLEGLGPTVVDVVESGPAGPAGPAGPNVLSSSTSTALNGILAGDGSVVGSLTPNQVQTLLGLATTDSPTFTGLNLTG